MFDKPTLDRLDNREDYGEVRTNSIGNIGGVVVVNVTHTDREHPRLISARAATRAERAAYLEFERELTARNAHG